MVRLTERSIIIEYITNGASGEELYNIQHSLLKAVQYINPDMNPLGDDINPIYYICRLIEETLPKLENYSKAYSPELCLDIPEKLNTKQIELLKNALFELKSDTKIKQHQNPIAEIIRDVA